MNNTTVDINFHELCGKLRSMKLSSMADTLEKQLANPNSGLQSFDERISEIICSEWDTRYTKKFNRFLKKATLKYPVQIATFCGQQGRIPRTVRAILSGQF